PDIGNRAQPQRLELAVGIERQLDLGDDVARMLVGEQRLAPLAGPFDGAPELARGPQHEAVLRILPALGTAAAAAVAAADAKMILRDLEDAPRQHVPHAMRILHVGIKREAAVARLVGTEAPARLHELRVDARNDVAPPDDLRRPCKGGLGLGFLADLEDM